MKGRGPIFAGAALGAVLVVVLLLGGDLGAAGSSLSPEPAGWATARAYLEARGAQVALVDAPALLAVRQGVLALVLPFQRRLTTAETAAIGDHLRAGGSVLYAYGDDRLAPAEQELRDALRLGSRTLRDPPPLAPWRWWRYRRETWELQPAEGFAGGPTLRSPAVLMAPTPLGTPRVAYRAPASAEGLPLVFDYPLHRGRVLVLPAALLSNAGLATPGHADLLESLRAAWGDVWAFDELHHGRVAPAVARETLATESAWDLFVAHLGLLYLLAVAALVRRFGPPWREKPRAAGSTAVFLESLGVLHHELGHHAAAAGVLVERARLLDPALPGAGSLAADAWAVTGPADLVALSRKIARAQSRSRPARSRRS